MSALILGSEDNFAASDLLVINTISRFKVTPVVEDASKIPVMSDASSSQNTVSLEESETQNSTKKQGRFQITRVTDAVLPNTVQTPPEISVVTDLTVPQIPVDPSISIPVSKSFNLPNRVPVNISQNVLLQHSSSNPALVSSVSDMLTPYSQLPTAALTRSISDIPFASESKEVLNVTKPKDFHVLSQTEPQLAVSSTSTDVTALEQPTINIVSDIPLVVPSSLPQITTNAIVQNCTVVTQKTDVVEDSAIPSAAAPARSISENCFPTTSYAQHHESYSLSQTAPGVQQGINMSVPAADASVVPVPYSVSSTEPVLAVSMPPPAVQPVLPCSVEKVAQVQQPMVQDANANTVHCGFSDSAKSVQVRVLNVHIEILGLLII